MAVEKADVLHYIQRHGPVRPADLVAQFPEDRKSLREHLRVLVDERLVGLNWHGKFEAVHVANHQDGLNSAFEHAK